MEESFSAMDASAAASSAASPSSLESLSWNEFPSLRLQLEDILDMNHFCDVSLVAPDSPEDGEVLAHRVILAAASPFFKEILFRDSMCRTASKHPTIYLSDVSHRHLQNIVDLIYREEIRIPNDEVHDFFDAGSRLKINGLFTDETGTAQQPRKTQRIKQESSPPAAVPKKKSKMTISTSVPTIVSQTVITPVAGTSKNSSSNVKTEGGDAEEYFDHEFEADYPPGAEGDDFAEHSESASHHEGAVRPRLTVSEYMKTKVVETAAGTFMCTLCGNTQAYRRNVPAHFKKKHVELSFVFSCPQCLNPPMPFHSG